MMNKIIWYIFDAALIYVVIRNIYRLNILTTNNDLIITYVIFSILLCIGMLLFTVRKWITWLLSLIFIIPSFFFFAYCFICILLKKSTFKIDLFSISSYIAVCIFIICDVIKYLSHLERE